MPDKAEQKKNRMKIDNEAFYTFFCNLYHSTKKDKNSLFTYLLTLILIRKRILRLDEIEKGLENETLHVYDTRKKTELTIEVPEVTEEAIGQAKEELEQIFECSTDE